MSIGISYKLTTNATTKIDKEIEKVLLDDNIDNIFQPLGEGIGSWGEPCSRWDSDYCGKELSKMFPNVVMILDGLSDEGTYYRDYFYNGKIQRANVEIMYESFDKELLVD